MSSEAEKRASLAAKWGKKKRMPATPLSPDTPAPRLAQVVAQRGPELTALAIQAWNARLSGEPIIDVAHQMGVTIEGAKQLIREAHDAIAQDLKEGLAHNRELDLGRVDMILKSFLPAAKEGDEKSATIVLKALAHRARLTGTEPSLSDSPRSNPQNVLVWIQQQLPSINKIVDALPIELEEG